MDQKTQSLDEHGIHDGASQDHRRSLAIGLLRAREAIMSHFRPILAVHDVTEQQWRVIRLLFEEGKLEATDIAERASILPPSLTRMIRSLEERGLITKHKDRADGRKVLLQITAEGAAVVENVMPESLKAYTGIYRRFGEERMETFLDMLDELILMKLEHKPSDEE